MYKFKQGYIANKQLKKIVSILQDEVDINWHITKMVLDQDFSETDFWTNLNLALKCDYFLIDTNSRNTFELGVVWTINYLRKMLLRSGHKNAVQQLDKFGIVDKAIVSLGNDHPNKTIDILVKDQGKKFKNLSALATYIKNKEK